VEPDIAKVSKQIEHHLEIEIKKLPKAIQKEALKKMVVLLEVYRDNLSKRLTGSSEGVLNSLVSSELQLGLREKGIKLRKGLLKRS
jgi:hypothetical protein